MQRLLNIEATSENASGPEKGSLLLKNAWSSATRAEAADAIAATTA